jgi:hypothetical protein
VCFVSHPAGNGSVAVGIRRGGKGESALVVVAFAIVMGGPSWWFWCCDQRNTHGVHLCVLIPTLKVRAV